MPAVTFHFKVDERIAYAARLLRKAHRGGARVAVVGPAPSLDRLDQLLWTAVALDFIPHARWKEGAARPRVADASPIWLCDRLDDAADQPVLVHLGEDMPDAPERFERIIEIVSTGEPEVLAARERWRRYKQLGYALEAHDAAAMTGA